MKLIININCYNEEHTLPMVLEELPDSIPGVDEIEIQVVDDGSDDCTSEVALSYGARVVRHKTNLGLGHAFHTGVMGALEHQCDVMVNTDADNQYPSRYIAELVQPILDGSADVVIGNREPWKVKHFSPTKRILQWLGNTITRTLAGTDIPDTISGFRAYSADALLKINVFTQYSYTLDTIVQASRKGLRIVSVPITTNAPTRKSRLFKNSFEHIFKSATSILVAYTVYTPFRFFFLASAFFGTPSTILLGRYLLFVVQGDRAGHIQSLVVSAIGFTLASLLFSLGVLASLVGINRRFIEDGLYMDKKHFYHHGPIGKSS